MLTKVILIIIFARSPGPETTYKNLGEFNSMNACQAAAATIFKQYKKLDLAGNKPPLFVCARQ